MPRIAGRDTTKRSLDILAHEEKCIVRLSEKKDVKLFPGTKILIWDISVENSSDIGNRSLGKMDFLRNHAGWQIWKCSDRKEMSHMATLAMKD